MALTPEEKEIVKTIAAFVAVLLLWLLGIGAIYYTVRILDDGGAARPSEWRR